MFYFVPRAEKLISRSIGAFELLIGSKRTFEKNIDAIIASEVHRDIQFVENHKFVCLPQKKRCLK